MTCKSYRGSKLRASLSAAGMGSAGRQVVGAEALLGWTIQYGASISQASFIPRGGNDRQIIPPHGSGCFDTLSAPEPAQR